MKWVPVTAEIRTTAERYQHTLSLDQTTSAAVGKPHKFNFFPKRNRTFLRYVSEKNGVLFWQVCDGSQPTTTIPWGKSRPGTARRRATRMTPAPGERKQSMTTDAPDQLSCRHLAGSLPAFLLAAWLVAACAEGLGLPAAQGAEPEVLLERVDKVYADGKWNGRLSVVPFLGRYYAFFRSAVAHDQDGAIRVITSIGKTTTRWSSSPYAQLNYEATLKAGKSLDPIAHGPAARVLFNTELTNPRCTCWRRPGGCSGTSSISRSTVTRWSAPGSPIPTTAWIGLSLSMSTTRDGPSGSHVPSRESIMSSPM